MPQILRGFGSWDAGGLQLPSCSPVKPPVTSIGAPGFCSPPAFCYSLPGTCFLNSLPPFTPLGAEPCSHSSPPYLIQNSVDSTASRSIPRPVPTLPSHSHLIIWPKLELISHSSTHRIRTNENIYPT